jgi:hypothetical protein
VPVIPSQSDQPANPEFDRRTYGERNLVERLVGKLEQFRRVATRYDKPAAHYLAFVQLASAMVWLRDFSDAAGRSGAAHDRCRRSDQGGVRRRGRAVWEGSAVLKPDAS